MGLPPSARDSSGARWPACAHRPVLHTKRARTAPVDAGQTPHASAIPASPQPRKRRGRGVVLPLTLSLAQVGDQLDRGDHELEILYFLERLQREAARAGGALHVLNGNHEARAAARRGRAGGVRRAGSLRGGML